MNNLSPKAKKKDFYNSNRADSPFPVFSYTEDKEINSPIAIIEVSESGDSASQPAGCDMLRYDLNDTENESINENTRLLNGAENGINHLEMNKFSAFKVTLNSDGTQRYLCSFTDYKKKYCKKNQKSQTVEVQNRLILTEGSRKSARIAERRRSKSPNDSIKILFFS